MLIPAPNAASVELRYAPLLHRDRFAPASWPRAPFHKAAGRPGWWEIDIGALGLVDGEYEYEFVLDGDADQPVTDPFAEEIVRFGGYRGLFRIRDGRRWRVPFSWDDELPDGLRLPDNNRIVIYEMPMRWMASADDVRQIGLGTFERAIFERLDELADLGVNAIELLPVQDSPDTLNWGYGTRFFFVPDIDMGGPVDLKLFVKRCHQRGIRVILDVVMNHATGCPLERLAFDWYFLNRPQDEPGREHDWGGRCFRYRTPAPDGSFVAREFHYRMADFWIRESRIDGFRIDEFKGIDNWDFIRDFRNRAWASFRAMFPDRPFIVIAEDSWRRAKAVHDGVTDAIWNFAWRDEARRRLRGGIDTRWGEPSRRRRIEAMVRGVALWDDLGRAFRDGFSDLAQAVNYITSHDVENEGEQRFMNEALGGLLRIRGLGDGSVEQVRRVLADPSPSPEVRAAVGEAFDRARGGFALLMTSVGIPMLLAGEEFADVHDLEHGNWRLKMSDPVDWNRARRPAHAAFRAAVRDLILLRTEHESLRRNETVFFHAHPGIDDDDGPRVFAYARTAGRPLGQDGQVVVIANAGSQDFPVYDLPWPWPDAGRVRERGGPANGAPIRVRSHDGWTSLSLAPFQVRVFTT